MTLLINFFMLDLTYKATTTLLTGDGEGEARRAQSVLRPGAACRCERSGF